MQKINIEKMPNKGRGVIATTLFKKGELIERVPVIIIPNNQHYAIEKTIFNDYTFSWGKDPEDQALALGYGSLYNHSYMPNAFYVKDLENMWIDFIALTAIEPGNEITINYNGDPKCQDPLWFSVMN
jgi:SET domain-containing protein